MLLTDKSTASSKRQINIIQVSHRRFLLNVSSLFLKSKQVSTEREEDIFPSYLLCLRFLVHNSSMNFK